MTLQALFCKGFSGLPESPDLTPVNLRSDQIAPVSNRRMGVIQSGHPVNGCFRHRGQRVGDTPT